MLSILKNKGYPRTVLQRAEKEVDKLLQETLLKSKKSEKTRERIPFVTTFDTHSKRIRKVVRKYWQILMTDPSTSKVFKDYPLFAYKRGKNVNHYLNCNSVIKGDTVLHLTQGTKIILKGYFTCMSKNVIYYLKCGKGYVGKTNRINEHRSSICNSQTKATSISQHWAECKQNVAQLRWQVLEEIKTKLCQC
ncbi:hypothetical protein XELAEV_18023573mg [Xenopus laevis]|uniref:GIY-YIG domain-containing protein n=1 Tax=Xenopus laevis TaxID=8355 RepID=A0A974D6X8_XENLA|nr:hypothetical protein XELAEV_18023573mg [Xenopus laevis]